MPIAKIQLEDGRVARFEVPEGTTQDQVMAFVNENRSQFDDFQPPQAEVTQDVIQEDPIFEGLPPDIVENIKQQTTKRRGRKRQLLMNRNEAKRLADLERIRQVNPYKAALLEDIGPAEAFAIGAGRGLTTIGRGLASPFTDLTQEEILERQKETEGFEQLAGQQMSATAGKIVGEAAPFLAAAPLAGAGLATTTAGRTLIPAATRTAARALGTGGLGATEAATIAAGEGREAEDIIKAGAIGFVTGGAFEVASPLARGVINKVKSSEPSRGQITKAIEEAAPSSDQLKQASRELFNEIDDEGIRLTNKSVSNLSLNLRKELEDSGLDAVNTPQASRALERLEDLLGENPSVRGLDRVRETAQVAAGNLQNKKESALGNRIIDSIDEYLDGVDIGEGAVGAKYKEARELWGRARRSELINDAIASAEDQATGLENGLRVKFRQILNNKKQRRFFNKEELNAMRQVVRGTKSANIAKLIGKMGISENQATNYLGAAIGAGGGAAAFGPAGAVIVPAIGQVSKGLAQKLTLKNARFADDVIRAGKNANRITAAYLKNTPKKQRSSEELAQLLMRPKVSLSKIKKSDPVVRQAVKMAQKFRGLAVVPAVGATAIAAEEE